MKNRLKKISWWQVIANIILIFFLVCMMFPLVLMVMTSFKSESQFLSNFWKFTFPLKLENYTRAWNMINGYFLNSLKVTVITVAGIIVVSVFAGFAFAKMRFKGKNMLYIAILSFRMIPTGLLIIPMFMNILRLGLNNSHWGVILPGIASGSIMAILLSRGFFEQLPDSVFESARIDGASELRILWSFVVPLSTPIIGTLAVYNFFGVFNQYMWPYIVLSDNSLKTIPIGIAYLAGEYGVDFGFQMAGYTLASIPLIILFLCTSKLYVNGITAGAVKS